MLICNMEGIGVAEKVDGAILDDIDEVVDGAVDIDGARSMWLGEGGRRLGVAGGGLGERGGD